MYKFAKTKNRIHRVHVEGGQAWKVEQCNLDDAKYFGLLDDEPEGTHCKYCFVSPAIEKEQEKTEEKVPALGKSDVPKSLVLMPKKLLTAMLAVVAGVFLLGGNASGVVLSPDLEPSSSISVSPSPSCNPQDLSGCGDLVIIIEKLIDEQLLHHLQIDHAPEVTPSPSPSPTPATTNTPSPTSTPRNNRTLTTPGPTSQPTTRPKPRPTSRPTTPVPTATPCFRPGNPQSNKDPCSWPVDDK